jgi:hypothetical protein
MDLSDLYEMLVLVWKMMIQMIQDLEVPFETTPVFKHQTQPLLNSEVSLSPLSFGFTEFCFGLATGNDAGVSPVSPACLALQI